MRRLIGALCLVLLLITSGCSVLSNPFRRPPPPPVVSEAVTVRVNGAAALQQIDGFGVNINGMAWGEGTVIPALDALSDDLGATLFRVVVDETDWEQQNDNDDPQQFNWDYYQQIYREPKFTSLWETLRYLEQKPGSQVILNVMGRVPEWMGRTVITPEAEDEWVEMVTSLVVYGRNEQGLALRLFSPLNEVDLGNPEGPKLDPQQYARLARKVVDRLDSQGIGDIRLIAPDTAYSDRVPEYLAPILSDATLMQRVERVAFHNYGGAIDGIPQAIRASDYPTLRFWVTEYSRWCEGCLTDPAESEQWALGADTADYLLYYLDRGASGALLYEGFDSYYHHHGRLEYWGILSYDERDGSFAPRHRYHTAAQIFRYVRPGMLRLAIENPEPDLKLQAFHDPVSGAFTLVGRNPVDHGVTLTVELAALPTITALQLTQTTETAPLVSAGAAIPVDGRVSIELAADSVFALSTLDQ